MSTRWRKSAPNITLDVDWAPDFVIDHVAEQLRERGVKATWFVTHLSPAVERLRSAPDLFELGIHPNFLPGSSHGDSPEAVLACVCGLVPDAVSSRSHAVCQSSPILHALAEREIRVDASIFLPGASHLAPVPFRMGGRTLLRVPYNWSDDYEMYKPRADWDATRALEHEGLCVFNFHPVLVYLNAQSLEAYEALKRQGELSTLVESQAAPFVATGTGAGTAFAELLDRLARDGASACVREFLDADGVA